MHANPQSSFPEHAAIIIKRISCTCIYRHDRYMSILALSQYKYQEDTLKYKTWDLLMNSLTNTWSGTPTCNTQSSSFCNQDLLGVFCHQYTCSTLWIEMPLKFSYQT